MITACNVTLGHFKNNDPNLHSAYWLSFWAAFVTWTLIGLTVFAVFYVVVFVAAGTVVLFGSGVGEVGVAGAGGAAAVEGGVVAAEAGVVGIEAGEAGLVGVEAAEAASTAEEGIETARSAEKVGKEAKEAEKEESDLSKARRQYQNKKQKQTKTKAEQEKEATETPEERQEQDDLDLLNSQGVSWIMTGFLLMALGLVITTGILSAITASNINQSEYFQQNQDNASLQQAYKYAVISASMCLAAAGLLVLGFIVYYIMREQHKRNIRKAIQREQQERLQAEQERQQKLSEIRQAKLQARAQKDAERRQEQEARRKELEDAQHQAMLLRVYQQAGVTNPPPGAVVPVPIDAGIPAPAPPPAPTAPATESQCYANLGVKSGAKQKEVLEAYQKLLTSYHPDICKSACCGPNFRIIKNSKDAIINKQTKSGCPALIACTNP